MAWTGARSGWSIRIGTVIGIPVRVHLTFLVLVAWFAWTSSKRGDDTLLAVAFLLLVFGCVLLHELGHAAVARGFGVKTRDIVLYPIGGIARLENIPSGKAELCIALAGPLVNLVLAGLLLGALVLTPSSPALLPGAEGPFLAHPLQLIPRLLVANLLLFLFNLVPAFPMDGGRVLRATLTLALSAELATVVATRVGQVLALAFAMGGLFFGNPLLVLVALFVFLGASQEAFIQRQRNLLRGRRVEDAMITRFEILRPQDSLREAARKLLDTHQRDFPVVDAWERLVGVLRRPALLEALAATGGDAAVLEVMDRDVGTIAIDAPLEAALERLMQRPAWPLFAMREERLVGMVTLDNVAEFVEIRRGGGIPRAHEA